MDLCGVVVQSVAGKVSVERHGEEDVCRIFDSLPSIRHSQAAIATTARIQKDGTARFVFSHDIGVNRHFL